MSNEPNDQKPNDSQPKSNRPNRPTRKMTPQDIAQIANMLVPKGTGGEFGRDDLRQMINKISKPETKQGDESGE